MILTLLIVLFIIFFIILGLLINSPFKISAALRKSSLSIKFTLRFFYALIPLSFFLRVEYLPRSGIRILKILKNGRIKQVIPTKKSKTRKKFGKALTLAALASVKFNSIETAGEIGIRSDSFLTVMLTGVIRIILDAAIKLFVFSLTDSRSDAEIRIGFFPCMTRNAFSLNLEGIAEINMPKLIKKTFNACFEFLKQKIVNKRRYEKCTLSKT